MSAREFYNATLFITSGEETHLHPVGRWVKDARSSVQLMIEYCNRALGSSSVEYNQHARVELWLYRDDGTGKLIYTLEK